MPDPLILISQLRELLHIPNKWKSCHICLQPETQIKGNLFFEKESVACGRSNRLLDKSIHNAHASQWSGVGCAAVTSQCGVVNRLYQNTHKNTFKNANLLIFSPVPQSWFHNYFDFSQSHHQNNLSEVRINLKLNLVIEACRKTTSYFLIFF